MKIGNGYDVHRLVKGRDLILGGVKIPHETGLLGHSDADVLIHAVIDAILGACALGDIGRCFPDSDAHYKDISSLVLLERTREMMTQKQYRLVNLDSIIVCQRPKLADYIPLMRDNLARALCTGPDNVSVKAKTEEGLGLTGDCSGIAAHAVVLIERVKPRVAYV